MLHFKFNMRGRNHGGEADPSASMPCRIFKVTTSTLDCTQKPIGIGNEGRILEYASLVAFQFLNMNTDDFYTNYNIWMEPMEFISYWTKKKMLFKG